MTNKLNRRLVLQGFGGALIALPLLEFTQGRAWAADVATTPKRFLVFFEHGGNICPYDNQGVRFGSNGANNWIDRWKPTSAPGQPLVLGTVHQPLNSVANDLVVLRGVDNRSCMLTGRDGGAHGYANASALTSAVSYRPNSTDDDTLSEGPSIDQVMAVRLAERSKNAGAPVRFASIDLEIPGFNYGTPFYRAARQRLNSEHNPRAAFDRIFAGVTTSPTPTTDNAAARARALKKSVLDGTRDQLSVYRNQLSSQDRQLVETHLEHIRSIETRLAQQAPVVSAACTKPSISGFDGSENWDNVARRIKDSAPLMMDILIAAFRCGLSNVGTMNLGDVPQKGPDTAFLNTPIDFDEGHGMHHWARDVGPSGPYASRHQDWLETMTINRQWRMGLLARLLAGLKATPEGNGTMLDNSLLLATSEFSNGSHHSVADLPILLAGKAGGRLQTGRHVNLNLKAQSDPNTSAYETRSSLHNLFTWILNTFDFPDAHFGSTGHAVYQGALTGL